MTRGRWIGLDGWPCDHPPGLIEALAELPGADLLAEDAIEGFARLIEVVDESANDAELPASQLVSAAASDAELRQFHDLAVKLADHIHTMHRPAVSALWPYGVHLRELAETLRGAAYGAKCSFGGTDAPEKVRGRRQKIAAAEVTSIVAEVFEQITGRTATFTSDPSTSAISGVWPDFLGKVFRALGIRASVASQVRAHGKSIK